MTAVEQDDQMQQVTQGLMDVTLDNEIYDTLSPEAQEAVKKLREFQDEHFKIEQEFEQEWINLKSRYESMFKPLYQKRSEVLCQQGTTDNSSYTPIPKFWINVFNKNSALKNMIEETDVPILEYLVDIKSEWDDLAKLESFTLEFIFAPNPYFSNTSLSKHFEIQRVPGEEDPFFKATKSTAIQWNENKDVTKKFVSKKHKNKRTQEIKVVKELVQNKNSFFNFFSDRTVPNVDAINDYSTMEIEELRNDLENHYSTGIIIRDRIIPFAIKWFMGEMESDESDDEWDVGDTDSELEEPFSDT